MPNAGTTSYMVKFTPDSKYQGGYGDYTNDDYYAEVTVSKQAVEVPNVEDKIYNGINQKSGLSDTDLYTVKSDDGGTNVSDKPSVTLSLKNPENYVWVTTENGAITEHSSPEYTVSYQIKKADLQLKVSANASITDLQYGQTLTSDPNPQKETVNNNQAPVQVKMSAPQMLRGYSAIYMRGTGEQTAEGTWSWNVVNGKVTEKDGGQISQPLDVKADGNILTYYIKATFTPTDSANLFHGIVYSPYINRKGKGNISGECYSANNKISAYSQDGIMTVERNKNEITITLNKCPDNDISVEVQMGKKEDFQSSKQAKLQVQNLIGETELESEVATLPETETPETTATESETSITEPQTTPEATTPETTPPETETSQTEPKQSEAPQTEPPQTETPQTVAAPQSEPEKVPESETQAAGNLSLSTPLGSEVYPAAWDEVIGVAGADTDEQGEPVSSLWYLQSEAVFVSADGNYRGEKGSSFAAPRISGVLADYLAVNAKDNVSLEGAKTYLKNQAEDAGEPGYDRIFGWGYVRKKEKRR